MNGAMSSLGGVDMGKYGKYSYPKGSGGVRRNKQSSYGDWSSTYLSFGTLSGDGEWYVSFDISTETFIAKKVNKI
jgi:hypothetical protein